MQKRTIIIRRRIFNNINVGTILENLVREGKLPHIALVIEQTIPEPAGTSAEIRSINEAQLLMRSETIATVSVGLAFEHVNGSGSSPWVNSVYATLYIEGAEIKGVVHRGVLTREFPFKPARMIEPEDLSEILYQILAHDFFGRRTK